MNPDQIERLLYLLVLGGALLAVYLVGNRQRFGALLRQAISWALIFLAVLAGYGLWEDVRRTVVPSQSVLTSDNRIMVPRGPDGHYHLTLDVNGAPIHFLVDTGASDIVLTQRDARRAGLDPSGLKYFGRASTANGEVRTAPVRLDEVRLGPIVDHKVSASVTGGDMQGSLLGMSYLNRFGHIEIAGNNLILSR
ncbi:MAG: retropepsin-like aspartic protease family protein [Marinibacterium sp.]